MKEEAVGSKVPLGILVVTLFFATGLLLTILAFLDLETMKNLVMEDGVIEYTQAVLFLMGAILWIYAVFLSWKGHEGGKRRLIFYILFCLLFLFFFLEEISYGQRLFGTKTPEALEEVNLQDETNIHNIGIGGTLLWIHILMALFVSMVGVILPVLKVGTKRMAGFFERLNFPVANQNLIACFALALVFHSSLGYEWYVPLFILTVIVPLVLILSGKFNDFFNNFDYPLLQFTMVAVMGLLVIGINVNSEVSDHLSHNIGFEIRELLIAMALFFFVFFEVLDIKQKSKTQLKDN